MAEKISTLIVKFDLHCSKCRKDVGNALGELREEVCIKSIIYADNGNTVTIVGPFDPDWVCKKLFKWVVQITHVPKKKEETKNDTTATSSLM